MANKKELSYYTKLWELNQQSQMPVGLPQSRTEIDNAKKDWISRKMTEDEILSRTGGLEVVAPRNEKIAIVLCVGYTFWRAHQEGCVVDRFGFAISETDIVFGQDDEEIIARIRTLGNGAVNGCDKRKISQVESELAQIDEVTQLLQIFLEGGVSRDEVMNWSKRFLESNGQTYLFDEKVARVVEEIDKGWAADRKALRKMRVKRSSVSNMLAEFFDDKLRQDNNNKERVTVERMKSRWSKVESKLASFSPDGVGSEIIDKMKNTFGAPIVQNDDDPAVFIIGENCLVDDISSTKWLKEFDKVMKLKQTANVKSNISLRDMFLARVNKINRIFWKSAVEDWRSASHLIDGIDDEIDQTLNLIFQSTGDELYIHEKRICELIFKIANQAERKMGQDVE